MHFARLTMSAALLTLAACGSQPAADQANEVAATPANRLEAKAELPPCPFQQIHELSGSNEGGRLLVTGRVDLMMAGFKPQLSPRSGGSGAIALDLSLASDPNAGVSDVLRYEQSGVPRTPRGEIWCGGERFATFDIVLVG